MVRHLFTRTGYGLAGLYLGLSNFRRNGVRSSLVFVVVALLALTLGAASVGAQDAGGLSQLSSEEVACSNPDESLITAGKLVVSGCFAGGWQLYVGNGSDEVDPWKLNPIESPPGRPGDIAAVRSTVGLAFDNSLGLLDVSSGTPSYSSFPFPDGVGSYYLASSVAAGRSSVGRERFAVPVFLIGEGGQFGIHVITRQETGPGGVGEPWSSQVVAVDAALPVPAEFDADAAPLAVLGDTIYAGWPTENGDSVVARFDLDTGEQVVLESTPQPSLYPSEFFADPSNGRVFLAWRSSTFDRRSEIGRLSQIGIDGIVSDVEGLPEQVSSFAVVERGEEDSALLLSTPAGEIFSATVTPDGTAGIELVSNVGSVTEPRVGYWLSGSEGVLSVADEAEFGGTLPPSHRIRVFQYSFGSNPFDVAIVAPDTDPNTFDTGPFDDIKDTIVGDPGLPLTECLVDVNTVDAQAICFVAGERDSYVDALIATERPPDEVLWIGRSSEEPVKP